MLDRTFFSETLGRGIREGGEIVGFIKALAEVRDAAASATRIVSRQRRVCADHNLLWTPPVRGSIVRVARDVGMSSWPMNGLRHPGEGNTCGWYLWAGEGELSRDADYFQPVHVEHLHERCPQVLPYLALPPGWRFLIAPGYCDAWDDPDLLHVPSG